MKQSEVPKGRIMVYGFSDEDISIVENCTPSGEYEVYVPDIVQDILAISWDTLIVNSAAVSPEDRGLLIEYFTELNGSYPESVFWIGYPKPPSHLRRKFFCYKNFGELSCMLLEKLKKSHQKVKKSRGFSKNLADCLLILSLIRTHPGIKTRELVDKLEIPTRTVQRYISTLQAAGEWIEYNTAQKGWKLQYGISILFGDHLREDV